MDALSFKSTTSFSLQHPPLLAELFPCISALFFLLKTLFSALSCLCFSASLGLQASEGAAGCCSAPCAAARVDTAWSKQHRAGN